jgi:hypothetical protein
MSSSLFSSLQGNTKCESSFFADTCTRCVPIFIHAKDNAHAHTSSPQNLMTGKLRIEKARPKGQAS